MTTEKSQLGLNAIFPGMYKQQNSSVINDAAWACHLLFCIVLRNGNDFVLYGPDI